MQSFINTSYIEREYNDTKTMNYFFATQEQVIGADSFIDNICEDITWYSNIKF